MEDREAARMRKYGESKTTRIMMATVPHVTSGSGLRKFQADGFLLTRVYLSCLRSYFCCMVGRNISVGTAICYGLDGPGIESLCGRDFPHPSRPAMGPTEPSVQWVPGFSPRESNQGEELTIHPHLALRLKTE